MAISKLALIGGSVGLVSAGAGGVAIYLNSGESIREYIEKKIGSNFKFIAEISEAEESLKARYSRDGEHKPKKGDAIIKAEEIIDWCKSSANNKFFDEKDTTYLSLKTWCFVNTVSLSENAKRNSNRVYVSNEAGSSDAWKTAWDAYNGGKTASTLRITDSTLSNLNGDNRDNGATDLHRWCSETGNKKMYEVDSETISQAYEKWCFKDSVG